MLNLYKLTSVKSAIRNGGTWTAYLARRETPFRFTSSAAKTTRSGGGRLRPRWNVWAPMDSTSEFCPAGILRPRSTRSSLRK